MVPYKWQLSSCPHAATGNRLGEVKGEEVGDGRQQYGRIFPQRVWLQSNTAARRAAAGLVSQLGALWTSQGELQRVLTYCNSPQGTKAQSQFNQEGRFCDLQSWPNVWDTFAVYAEFLQ